MLTVLIASDEIGRIEPLDIPFTLSREVRAVKGNMGDHQGLPSVVGMNDTGRLPEWLERERLCFSVNELSRG